MIKTKKKEFLTEMLWVLMHEIVKLQCFTTDIGVGVKVIAYF